MKSIYITSTRKADYIIPDCIDTYLKYISDTIISGGANGADTYAREFAK